MRVLFFCPHSRISGGVKVIYYIAQYLVNCNIDVYVAVLKHFDRANDWYALGKKTFNVVDGSSVTDTFLNDMDVCITFGDGPDISHLTCKKVLFLQGHSKEDNPTILSAKYDLVIVTSPWLRKIAKQYNTKVAVVPPGVDDIFQRKEIETKNNMPTIGTVYHTSKEKNFIEFVNIVRRYRIKHKEYLSCVIISAYNIGSLPSLDEYLIPYTLYIRPRPELLPFIYSSTSVWVSTSLNEGFGLPPLEAMRCGCPVVMRPNRGLDTVIVHNKNCLLYENYKDATNHVYDLVHTRSLRSGLRNGGYALSKLFSWNTTYQLFYNALSGLL